MDVGSWKPTDSGNGSGLAPDFWPEGQHPSTLNDCGRALMGGAARWFKDTNGSIVGTNYAAISKPAMHFPVNANFSSTAATSLLIGTAPHDASATHQFLCDVNGGTRQFVMNVDGSSGFTQIIGGEFSSGEMLAVAIRNASAVLPLHSKKTKLLASGSITSSVSSFTISGLSADGVIHIAVSGMRSASTTGLGLRMRFGNPTIQSGSTDYECAAVYALDPSTASAFGSTSTSAISISLAAESPESARLYARLHGFGDGKVAPSVAWTIGYDRFSDAGIRAANGHGSMTSQLTANAIQFFFSAANFTADTNNPIYYRAWTE